MMNRRAKGTSRSDRRSRRGVMYVLVLGTASIVMIIGLSGLLGARISGRVAKDNADFLIARQHARSGMQMGLLILQADPQWRSHFTSGLLLDSKPDKASRLLVQASDPDGLIADDATDPLILTATGEYADARYQLRLNLTPQRLPIDALKMSVHSGLRLQVRSGKTVTITGAPLSTNAELRHDGDVIGSVEGVTESGGGAISGTKKIPAPTKSLPDATAFAGYAGRATAITPAGTMAGFVIGPGVNSLGASNPYGIYSITTGSKDLTIENARIYGTLYVNLNGKKLTLQRCIIVQPTAWNMPALLVDGELSVSVDPAGTLTEATQNVNFNPPGAPHGGVSDSDKVDTYGSSLMGLIHSTGTLKVETPCSIRGILLANGECELRENCSITYLTDIAKNPPEGYSQPGVMTVTQGGWEQVVTP